MRRRKSRHSGGFFSLGECSKEKRQVDDGKDYKLVTTKRRTHLTLNRFDCQTLSMLGRGDTFIP